MPLTAIWIRYLWLFDSSPAACLGFISRLRERDRRINSRVVSASPSSLPSLISFSDVTLWLTYEFTLTFLIFGLRRFWGNLDFFPKPRSPGDNGSSSFLFDELTPSNIDDSFPSIDILVESFYPPPPFEEWSLSLVPGPPKLFSEPSPALA